MIHTRVSVVLERELKQLAGSLRVPVSNVVRAILEDAVGKIDEVGRFAEGEIREVADRLEKHREVLRKSRVAGVDAAPPDDDRDATTDAAPADSKSSDAEREARAEPKEDGHPGEASSAVLENVIGFQPLLLARAEMCAVCGQPLPAGEEAFVGIREDGGPRVIVGSDCLPFPPK